MFSFTDLVKGYQLLEQGSTDLTGLEAIVMFGYIFKDIAIIVIIALTVIRWRQKKEKKNE